MSGGIVSRISTGVSDRGVIRLIQISSGAAAASRGVSEVEISNRFRTVAISDVWSNVSLTTVPRSIYGEITTAGTRTPYRSNLKGGSEDTSPGGTASPGVIWS